LSRYGAERARQTSSLASTGVSQSSSIDNDARMSALPATAMTATVTDAGGPLRLQGEAELGWIFHTPKWQLWSCEVWPWAHVARWLFGVPSAARVTRILAKDPWAQMMLTIFTSVLCALRRGGLQKGGFRRGLTWTPARLSRYTQSAMATRATSSASTRRSDSDDFVQVKWQSLEFIQSVAVEGGKTTWELTVACVAEYMLSVETIARFSKALHCDCRAPTSRRANALRGGVATEMTEAYHQSSPSGADGSRESQRGSGSA
jgi:hypothetical protein